MSAVVAPVQGSWINSGYTQCVKKDAFAQAVAGGYTKVAGSDSINANNLTVGQAQGYQGRRRRSSLKNTNKSNPPPKPPKLPVSSSKILVDTDLNGASKSNYPFLLNGQGEWQVVPSQIKYAIQTPQTFYSFNEQFGVSPVSIPYSSAALIEFFSVRLAMASSAFVTSYASTSNIDFLNRTTIEQDIITDFSVQAQLLFSWACYLRNIMTPASYAIGYPPTNPVCNVNATNGYTLGALDTFAGVVVINPYATHGATEYVYTVNGKNQSISIPALDPTDIQQVIFPYTTIANGQTVGGPVSRLASFDGGPSTYRFSAPGFTAFQASLVGGASGATVTFLPVSNFVNSSGNNTYAVQEPADNWWLAPVANPNVNVVNPSSDLTVSKPQQNSFRQVTFQLVNGAGYYFTYGIGSIGTTFSPQVSAPNSIVYQANASTDLVNGNLPALDQMPDIGLMTQKYGPSRLPNCYNDPNYTSFFADLQPWAIAVQIVIEQSNAPDPTTGVYEYGYAVVPVGLVKLNSFDFPLVFAQNPIASAYTAANSSAQTQQEVGGQYSPSNPLVETSTVLNQYTNLGIAFTQRDVWQGPEKLYSLVQSPAIAPELPTIVVSGAVEGGGYVGGGRHQSQSSTVSNVDPTYSMAYLFLQALYNGHLYSSGASNSLYSAMKTNGNIKGYDVSTGAGIGSVSYDYTSENGMTLYPLTTTFPIDSDTQTLKDVWPINEPRPEPALSDWLSQESPVDWVFLRALMVMRAFIENTGITELALPYLPQILAQPNSSITSAGGFDLYIGQNLNPTAAGSPAYQTVYLITPPVQPAPVVSTSPAPAQTASQNQPVNTGSNGSGLGGI